jgi:hypothetical protein
MEDRRRQIHDTRRHRLVIELQRYDKSEPVIQLKKNLLTTSRVIRSADL